MDYESNESNENRTRLTKATNSLGSNSNGIEGILRTFPILVYGLFGLLFFGITSAILSYYILIVVVIMVILFFIINHYVLIIFDKLINKKSKVSTALYTISDIARNEKSAKDIRNYNLVPTFNNLLDSYYKTLNKMSLKINLFTFLPSFEITIFTLIRDLLAYALLINDLISSRIDPTSFTAMLATITAFNSYIDTVITNIGDVSRCAKEISFIRDYFDTKQTFNHDNNQLSNELNNPYEIEVRNLSYKYPNSDRYILKDLNFKIKANEKLAIVGLNGAGKTTLIKLLTGLYYPSEGEILVNGHNIKDYNIDDYYKNISVVNQEVNLLAFSIKENIVCSSNYDENKFNNVINESGLKDKINSLENKENSYISKNFDDSGISLSGGEIQKVLLARALYKDSKFLVLDEPTSALDPIAEAELYEKYNDLTKDKTSIFISHRLSSTKFCDEIIYLKDGKIIEEGSHEELMKEEGEYYKLFNIQAKYYKEKDEGENVYE